MFRPALLVQDILDCINKIEHYSEGLDYDEFVRNTLVFDAVVRNLHIIGEATRRLPAEYKQKNPAIQWREIVDMRYRLNHEYFGIIPALVFETVRLDLPILRLEILKLL